jgi:predicted dehydrogenase
MNKVRISFVGAGAMAREHVRAFATLKNVVLCGIYSRTTDKARQLADEFGIQTVTESIEALRTDREADIVVVTVNAEAIHDVAIECCEHAWTILLEKPAGCNIEQAREILSAAGNKQHKVFVALNRRFLSSTEIALHALNQSDESRFIHVQDQQSMSAARIHGHPDIVVNNCMFANSIHLIDYFSLLARGTMEHINVLSPWRGEGTRLVLAHLVFSSGDEGLYEGIWEGPGPWAVTASTISQRWELKPLEIAAAQKAGSREIIRYDQSEADQLFKPGFVRQSEELVKAHLDKPSKSVTLKESFKSMQLVAGIFSDH